MAYKVVHNEVYCLLDELCATSDVHRVKKIDLTIDHNFGRCRLMFRILSLTDSQRN